MAAAQVFQYRETHGAWPGTLEEALRDPGTVTDLDYRVRPDGSFEVSGTRGEQTVVYHSTEPLRDFAAAARTAIETRPER